MTAPKIKMLAHNGGLPSGNYPATDLVRYIRADAPELLALAATMRKMREGWENALELGLIPERHRMSAQILRDDAKTALSAYEALK